MGVDNFNLDARPYFVDVSGAIGRGEYVFIGIIRPATVRSHRVAKKLLLHREDILPISPTGVFAIEREYEMAGCGNLHAGKLWREMFAVATLEIGVQEERPVWVIVQVEYHALVRFCFAGQYNGKR